MDDSDDRLWHRDEVESPCVKICVIHPQARLCTGCLRSMDEIAAWSRMGAQARRAVLAELPGRGPLPAVRRGGRAGHLARRAAQGEDSPEVGVASQTGSQPKRPGE